MIIFLCFFALAIATLCQFAGFQDLLLVAFSCSGLAMLSFTFDLILSRKALESVSCCQTQLLPKLNVYAVTSLGQSFLKGISDVRYTIVQELQHNSTKEIEPKKMAQREKSMDALWSVFRDSEECAAEDFFQRVLDCLHNMLAGQTVSIAWIISDAKNTEVQLLSLGAKSTRFESQFLFAYDSFFQSGMLDAVGFRDELERKSWLADFSQFGFRYSLSVPIEWGDEGESSRCILWSGYEAHSAPDADEMRLLRQVGRELALELKARGRLKRMQQEVQDAQGASKAKSEFIAHMSHDIRSPLNNIRSVLNLFKLEGFTADTDKMIEVALSNCETMSEIVEDILDYTKYSAGQLHAKRTCFDLALTLESAVESFAVSASVKSLGCNFYGCGTSANVVADKRQLKRVLYNLISNSTKYTELGQIDVFVRPDLTGCWRVSVRDTGVGMTESQLEQLFTPFCRFHDTKADGIGLGLTLTKILVELNFGKIQVRSQEAIGSLFEILIPAEDPHQVAQLSQELALERIELIDWRDKLVQSQEIERHVSQKNALKVAEEAPGEDLRILIVDDDVDCVDTLARGLEAFGCRVFKASSVKNAMSVFNYECPDIVLTDMEMPEGGGARLLEYVSKSLLGTPVFVVTGRSDEAFQVELLNRGVARVFCKPVDIDTLVAAFLEIVPRKLEERFTPQQISVQSTSEQLVA